MKTSSSQSSTNKIRTIAILKPRRPKLPCDLCSADHPQASVTNVTSERWNQPLHVVRAHIQRESTDLLPVARMGMAGARLANSKGFVHTPLIRARFPYRELRMDIHRLNRRSWHALVIAVIVCL